MAVRTIGALNGGPLPARTLDGNALQTLYCRAVALGLPTIGNCGAPLLFYTCLNLIDYTCFELICKRRRSKPPGCARTDSMSDGAAPDALLLSLMADLAYTVNGHLEGILHLK